MAVEANEKAPGKVLVFRASRRLTREDYERFLPDIERLIRQYGKIRVLFDMHDFHGWKARALWQDINVDTRLFWDIERLAMVAEKASERGMAEFCRPFTPATICYFDRSQANQASAWVQAELPIAQASGSGAT